MACLISSILLVRKILIKEFPKLNLIQGVLCASLFLTPISLQATQPDRQTKELSPSELKALAPVVSIENAQVSSLVVEAVFSAPSIHTAIRYRVYYSQANGYALYVRDMRDETPIFLIAENKALLFDPSEYELILVQDIGLMFELGMKGEDLQFASAFRGKTGGPKPEIINTLNMDFASIFNRVTINLKGERINEGRGRYILSGETALGSVCIAEIDPSAIIPFIRVGFYRKGESIPFLNFSRLEANGGIESSVFIFPIKDLMDRGLAIKTATFNQGPLVNLMSLMGRVLFVRSAVAFPQTRKDLVKLGIIDSDWTEIEKRDKKVSQVLREVFWAR